MQPEPEDLPPVLPDAVRRALVGLAAEVLPRLPEPEVPASLRRVRGFAPAKRAAAGAAALAAALERDPVFRVAVAGGWRERHPELAEALDAGTWPAAADPVQHAVGLYLSRPEGWTPRAVTVLAGLQEQEASERAKPAEQPGRLEALERQATRWREQAEQDRAATADLQEQLAQARRELRRLRADADRARAQARDATAERDKLRAEADQVRAEHDAALLAAQERVRRAEAETAQARRAARDGRSLAGARARLLLDTVIDAATGLRRELALPPETVLPADVVAQDQAAALAARPGAGRDGTTPDGPPAQARAADDPAVLDALVRLPRTHLVVDGYNVTKTGYGTLTLVEQRTRLVDALLPLAARTGAEITCCFDGAEVTSRSAWLQRGVRVMFSDPGTTADELIGRLVRAEPPGRPLVVVSSDAEVAAAVTSAGARAVPSAALLRLLERGR